MPATENKRLIMEVIEDFNDRERLDAYMARYSMDCVIHGLPIGDVHGREAIGDFYRGFFAGIPDANLAVEDILAEGDRVSARLVITGTHTGEFLGVPASGNPVDFAVISIFQIRDGDIVERWSVVDSLGLLQQIGAIPATEPATV